MQSSWSKKKKLKKIKEAFNYTNKKKEIKIKKEENKDFFQKKEEFEKKEGFEKEINPPKILSNTEGSHTTVITRIFGPQKIRVIGGVFGVLFTNNCQVSKLRFGNFGPGDHVKP